MSKMPKKARLPKMPGAKASVATLEHAVKSLNDRISARKKQVAEYTRAEAAKIAEKKRKATLRSEIGKKKAEYAKLK